MPIRGLLFPSFFFVGCLLAASLPAAATSSFWNGPYFATTGSVTGPWTYTTANGFASNQGSPTGDGTDLAAHAYATTGAGENAAFESIVWAEFTISDISGATFANVSVAGSYLLQVFGQGSAQVQAFLCQGFTNQCQVNFTPIWLALDSITSNLSPTNESKAVPYVWNGQLLNNVPYTLKLHVIASALENTQARAFVDPAFTIGTAFGVFNLDSVAQNTNPNFVPPPVPEPSAALLLLPGLLFAVRRRP